MERVRLQIEADPAALEELDYLRERSRSKTRVDVIRRALDVYMDLMKVREEDGEVKIVRKDGVVERLRL